jgi:NitT/TauT family transport system substrate-binding protein
MTLLGRLLLLLALGLAARAEAATPITIGVAPVVPTASTYLALEKGWLAEAGFDAKIEELDSATKLIPFLANGQMQVVHGGLGAVYFSAMAQGLPITLALDSGSSPINQDLLVRPDLAGTIKTIQDLKGRNVAFVAPAGVPIYSVGKLLETVGLSIKDIELKYMPFPSMGAAFANKAIDAALEVPPWGNLMVERGFGVRWLDPSTMIAPQPLELVAYAVNTDWATAHPDLARRLFLVLARAGREYCQAYHHGPNRAEISAILVKHKVLTDAALLERMPWQARDPNGKLGIESLVDIQDWFHKNGMLEKTAPRERLADASYAEAAAKEFGPFEVANKESTLKGCR